MYIKYSHLAKVWAIIWDKCLHQDNTNALSLVLATCKSCVLSNRVLSADKLHILPFNNAESNNMNTCILQCTFMSVSGRSEAAPPGQSCGGGGERPHRVQCFRVTEASPLLWALGCSGQWWQRRGRANHSGAPRQWMQARLRYR